MTTRFDDERPRDGTHGLRTMDGGEPGSEPEPFKEGIQALRDSLRAAAEKPNAFWTRQSAAISQSLRHPAPASWLRPALLWAPASIIVLACLLLFNGKSELPAPDFAVGADQTLLVDVERALYRDCPEALAPAATLVQEIR